ncbi:PorP/SprF family type IX secretion system membrane protein [Ascidiimonas aurantiaca]|uniref:PorP/SprF family type IX secretion system membrane protein n=1 Tax=Ascidiimonas aurantiaca TaxID=1685432 RepID=UPI0030EDF243
MLKKLIIILMTGFFMVVNAQQQSVLPVDWRQHNLTKYNTNLFNPALSFIHNEGMNLGLWGRVQWVGVEDSPRTYLVNYNGRAGEKSGAGLALFQHNIGLFIDSGLLANYARGIQLGRESWLTFGINLIAFRRGLNQGNFITPEPDPIILESKDDIIMAVMPGITLTLGNFNLGVTSENLFDYNFSEATQQTDFSDKIFLGHASYDFQLPDRSDTWKGSFLRATAYSKTIPDQDLQYGMTALMNVPRYGWLQAGYNNFYGVSGGLGAQVAPGISLGFLVETGTQNTNRAFGATYEVVAAIEFGKRSYRPETSTRFKEGPKPKKQLEKERETLREEQEKETQRLAREKEENKNTPARSANTPPAGNIPKIAKDSLSAEAIEDMDIEILETYQIDKNSNKEILGKVFKENAPNSRYKAVERIEGVQYGFYLVVNVFAQKKYFDLFMRLLSSQGLEPKYFYNEENNYYYVYLRKYDKLSDIERDRRTQYNRRYTGETWILWVRRN